MQLKWQSSSSQFDSTPIPIVISAGCTILSLANIFLSLAALEENER